MPSIRSWALFCLFTVSLALAGTAAAQDIVLPPVGIPGFSLVGQASFLPTLIPNEPLPPMPVPLLPVDTPPVSAGLGSVRVCGADDNLQGPELPVQPPGGLPVEVHDLDLIPCEVSGSVDATNPCTPASPVMSGPAGAVLLQGAAAVDGNIGRVPVVGPAFASRAPATNLLANCAGSTPGVVGIVGNDPSDTQVQLVGELPVCPYPDLQEVPCETIPVDRAINQAIADSGELPLNREGCTFDKVYVDCGTFTTPLVTTPTLPVLEDEVSVDPMSVDSGELVRQGVASLPQGGNIPINAPVDQETPGMDPVGVDGMAAGSLGQCTTPGLPGPNEGRLPGPPKVHAWINQTGSGKGGILGVVDDATANPPAMVDPDDVPSQATPLGPTPVVPLGPYPIPQELRALLMGLPRTQSLLFNTDIFGPVTGAEEQAYTGTNRQLVNTVHALWPFAGPGGNPSQGGCQPPSGTLGAGATLPVGPDIAMEDRWTEFNLKVLAAYLAPHDEAMATQAWPAGPALACAPVALDLAALNARVVATAHGSLARLDAACA